MTLGGVRCVSVVGAGYVGLTAAACLAELGHDVVCADVDGAKVARLQAGEITIFEDGLEALVEAHTRTGRLRFVHGTADLADREFVFLCLPTPSSPDGSADLSFLSAAIRDIAPRLRPGAVVVNKSTVPVGSTRFVQRELDRPDVAVVSNPEFLREGSAVYDFLHPDRVVIGADDTSTAMRVAELYERLPSPILITDAASAETIKYAANAFLATKVAFVNSMAAVCEGVGADIADVMLGVGYDRRIGHEFLTPGPGWGGSCFPKDTSALVRIAEETGFDFELLRSAIASNHHQFDRIADKVRDAAGGQLEGVRVGALGLTFKAGTDDLRESPALHILRRLAGRGAHIRAYDPRVTGLDLDWIEVMGDAYDACDAAKVVVVLTEWEDFKRLDLDKVSQLMSGRTIVDARNVLDPREVRHNGLEYSGVGRR